VARHSITDISGNKQGYGRAIMPYSIILAKKGCVLEKPYLTVEEIAEMLQVSIDTVRNWINRKRNPLPAFKIGREWRVERKDLNEFIQQRKNIQKDDQ
jgi:excisionase family DNA binding protein